jgi:hypothetical protein
MDSALTQSGSRLRAWLPHRPHFFEWAKTREGFPRLVLPSWIFGVLVPALGLSVAIWIHDTVLVFVYSFTAILVAVLSIWLLRRGRVGRLHGLFEGAFLGGELFAAAIGAVLLPLAIITIALGIGGSEVPFALLAFYGIGPLAWMFILDAQRAQARLHASPLPSRSLQRWIGFLAPYLLTATLYSGAARVESDLSDEIASAPVAELDVALNHLFEWRAVVCVDDVLRHEYRMRGASDPEGARRIEETYERWTGSPLNGSD